MSVLGDKEITDAMLTQFKSHASALTTFILESKNEQLRNDATWVLNKTFEKQKQLFDIMNQKGWYPVEAASQQEVYKAQQNVNVTQ